MIDVHECRVGGWFFMNAWHKKGGPWCAVDVMFYVKCIKEWMEGGYARVANLGTTFCISLIIVFSCFPFLTCLLTINVIIYMIIYSAATYKLVVVLSNQDKQFYQDKVMG